MVADSSDIDSALVAKLGSDVALLAVMTNGVYVDEAPQGFTKFVIVSLIAETDEQALGGRSYEDALYLVKAVALGAAGADVKTAAARIDALLEGSTLTVTGYKTMVVQRETRVRYTEVDDADPSIRWQHRGGRYRVQMSVG